MVNARSYIRQPPLALLALLLTLSLAPLRAGEPWTDKELKDPAALVATLGNSKASQPVILNVGPVQQIKGAIAIGPASVQKNLDKLKLSCFFLDKKLIAENDKLHFCVVGFSCDGLNAFVSGADSCVQSPCYRPGL